MRTNLDPFALAARPYALDAWSPVGFGFQGELLRCPDVYQLIRIRAGGLPR
jgi:hypothetical protein